MNKCKNLMYICMILYCVQLSGFEVSKSSAYFIQYPQSEHIAQDVSNNLPTKRLLISVLAVTAASILIGKIVQWGWRLCSPKDSNVSKFPASAINQGKSQDISTYKDMLKALQEKYPIYSHIPHMLLYERVEYKDMDVSYLQQSYSKSVLKIIAKQVIEIRRAANFVNDFFNGKVADVFHKFQEKNQRNVLDQISSYVVIDEVPQQMTYDFLFSVLDRVLSKLTDDIIIIYKWLGLDCDPNANQDDLFQKTALFISEPLDRSVDKINVAP